MQSVVFMFLLIFGGQVFKSEGYHDALWYQYFELCNTIRTHPEQQTIPCPCPPRTEDLSPYLSANGFSDADQTVIPQSWLCNYIEDCPNGSDEKYCLCEESEYKCGCPLRTQNCHYGQGCYKESEICNGRFDCMDGTDELNCTCASGTFRCACQDNNTCAYPEVCILEHQTCDGKSDCSDGSDEADCQCAGEFSCGCRYVNDKCHDPTSCIPLASKCDGINDCVDGSDELECEFAGIQFYCACARNGSCESRLPAYVPWEFVCNRNNDCGDWSDEVNCQCGVGQFKCNCNEDGCATSPGCLDTNLKVCDAIDDCGDFSDEINCTFASEVFICDCFAKGQTCSGKVANVQTHKVCDGFYDCSDHSDERMCACVEKFECKCARFGSDSCAGDTWCIDAWQACDGYKDCVDGSDEVDCYWPDYWFVCSCANDSTCTGNYLASLYAIECDGENDCGDWSDEQWCYSCPWDLFQCDCYSWLGANCTNYAGCVEQSKVCDRVNDCGDWSDERNCLYFHCDCSSFKTPTLCYAGSVKEEKRCNLENDCGDWSDERDCICPENDFRCPCDDCGLQPSCVKSSNVCDGVNDCGDGSDEIDCVCPNGKTPCCQQNTTDACPPDAACIWKDQFCDGFNNCGDWSDEYACNCTSNQARCGCIFNESDCDSQQKCINLIYINDGVLDCESGDDETCSTSSISFSVSCFCQTMYCPDVKTRDQMMQHTAATMNGSTTICHPVAFKTYFNGTPGVKEPEWACVSSICDTDLCHTPFVCDNRKVTVARKFCLGYNTCSIMSDLSENNLGFRCPTGFSGSVCILPQINLYDEIAHCSDASDLCFVDGKMSCFECFDKKLIISPKQVCDGIVDCYDVSDECFCADQTVCDEVLGTSRTRCTPGQFYCNEDLGCVDETAGMCNEFVNCTNNANTARCRGYEFYRRTTITCHNIYGKIQATLCDGRPECKDFSDECETCPDRPVFCDDYCRLYMDTGERYCNGEKEVLAFSDDECPPGFDEKNCTMRFYCTSGSSVSIDVDRTCDGLIDCQNAEDEAESLCSSTRFYCLNKTPISVDKSQIEDGKRDCADGSDECPPDNGEATIFSSQYELIGNQFILAIFWIMALVSIAGNAAVFATTAKEMLTWNKPSVAMQYNSLFVLNLSLSDFCMGLYLLLVCIKAAQFSGSYCFHDKPWRTSAFCSCLGALVVLSTEASVFIMTAMTTFRVITIMRPFITRTLTIIWGRIAIVSCWLLAILISTLPLFISEDYFASGVWFPNYFYKTDQITKTELFTLASRMGQHNSSTWFETKRFVKSKIPYLPILGDIGYYGETSVCMPRIFVNVGDAGWGYSAFIMFLNFALFLYMVICYLVIYRKSTNNVGKSGKRSKKMQSRISRLVFTDFACWVPLCTLAFIQLTGISLPVVVYAVSAGVLLPINSALNPMIYSDIVSGVIGKVYNFCRLTVSGHQASGQ